MITKDNTFVIEKEKKEEKKTRWKVYLIIPSTTEEVEERFGIFDLNSQGKGLVSTTKVRNSEALLLFNTYSLKDATTFIRKQMTFLHSNNYQITLGNNIDKAELISEVL